jgi:hypothetical protein
MLHTIAVSEPIFQRLTEEARRAHTTPNHLAEQLLTERLSPAWEAELDALLARVQARMVGFEPTEIETDITAAAEEVKAERRARRAS